jgi:para-aminobenzoate synthetase/4-amino-4-deoxychorismate lyase
MTTPTAVARFDDLVTGTALLCPPPHRVLTAHRPEDVVPVLAEVDCATRGGNWAFGYVSYEAAAGLDPALTVAAPTGDDPPLVWFGLCGTPAEVPPVEQVARSGPAVRWIPDWTAEQHSAAVARVRAHIAAGETYQCNLTDRLRADLDGDLSALYAELALASVARTTSISTWGGTSSPAPVRSSSSSGPGTGCAPAR